MSTPLPVRSGCSGWTFFFGMSKVPYRKPPLSYEEQLDRLADRGLILTDREKARHLLEQISYYRLSGYWYPLLDLPKHEHRFRAGSTFEQAFQLYCFDRRLRMLMLNEIEKIEIAIRAKLIYVLWHEYNAYWFLDPSLFKNSEEWGDTLDKLRKEYSRSDEVFIRAFNEKYSDEFPPSCMILEVSSFGNLSRLFANLKPGRVKRDIANHFGLDDKTFVNWLHFLVYIRNLCAHHSRLWNRSFRIKPKMPIGKHIDFLKTIFDSPQISNNISSRTYILASIVWHFLRIVNPATDFKSKLVELFDHYPQVDIMAMGFPSNWQELQHWR